MNAQDPIRLTSLAQGGGCGCKIAPGLLSQILRDQVPTLIPPELLVGLETSDDAAVYQLNSEQALVATTDFFTPIVDNPYDFGRIAAANALSDVYAMGAQPIFALAIAGMPIKQLPVEVIREILAGGASICQQAGIPIAGGHSIDSAEPIYGLVALGLTSPSQIKRNSTAQAGDVLILSKPLGVGIYSAALKRQQLSQADYQLMLAQCTQLNQPGSHLAQFSQVHAMTDVTGFGLLGHLLEICRGSRLHAEITYAQVPLMPQTRQLAAAGYVTGASTRNWAAYGAEVSLSKELDALAQAILADPQTSGGLLLSCAPEYAAKVLEIFNLQGFHHACVIGHLSAIEPGQAGTVRVNSA